MQLSYINIYVPEVEPAMEFYSKAFGLKKLFLHESKLYGEMETGITKLSFAADVMAEMNGLTVVKNNLKNPSAGFEIAFTTTDVKAAFEKALQNGAVRVTDPVENPWGQTVAYVRDLNGCLVEFCTPMS